MSFVGKNLKAIREERSLTQEQIAKQCGVPQNQWSKWEGGKSEPKIKSLLRVAVSLDLPLNRLVVGVNRAFDLACQKRDQSSGSSSHEGDQPNDPASTRMELERLSALVARYQAQTRKVLAAVDDLDETATALEEIGTIDARTASRVRRTRKTG